MEFVSRAAFSRWKSTFILSRFPKREKEGESKSVRPLSNRRSTINGQPTLWTQSIVLMSPWTDIVAAKARARAYSVRRPFAIRDLAASLTTRWWSRDREVQSDAKSTFPSPPSGQWSRALRPFPSKRIAANGTMETWRKYGTQNREINVFRSGGNDRWISGRRIRRWNGILGEKKERRKKGRSFPSFAREERRVRGSMSALKGARARAHASACLS